MWKEKTTRIVKVEKHEPDTCPMIVGKVKKSIPRTTTVKSKEKTEVTTSHSKCLTTTCETSGNIMRLCVNLMPVLAAAKELVEEEEGEEDNSCTSEKEAETSSKNDPSDSKSVEQTLEPSDSYTGLNLNPDSKQTLNPRFVLPPIIEPKPAPECDRQKVKRCHTSLPPTTSLSEKSRPIYSNFTIKGCGGEELVTCQEPDSRPWMENPLFSRSRSAEFRLPDISLSSLDALLQTVTQKLGRKRRGGGEGPWRRVHSDRLLADVREQHLREMSVGQHIGRCTDNGNPAHIKAATETSADGRHVNRQRDLPPLILAMAKKNLQTSNTLQ